jgi:hypothetical protein
MRRGCDGVWENGARSSASGGLCHAGLDKLAQGMDISHDIAVNPIGSIPMSFLPFYFFSYVLAPYPILSPDP